MRQNNPKIGIATAKDCSAVQSGGAAEAQQRAEGYDVAEHTRSTSSRLSDICIHLSDKRKSLPSSEICTHISDTFDRINSSRGC